MAKEGKTKKVDGRNLGSTGIERCTCEHAFQDKRYGKKMRVMNKTAKGWRCSVCRKDQ